VSELFGVGLRQQTIVSLGCERCPISRLIVAEGAGGLITAHCLTGRVPYEAGVTTTIAINGREEMMKEESVASQTPIQPTLRMCTSRCEYPQLPAVANELIQQLNQAGLPTRQAQRPRGQ
jgi:hypothetical protein